MKNLAFILAAFLSVPSLAYDFNYFTKVTGVITPSVFHAESFVLDPGKLAECKVIGPSRMVKGYRCSFEKAPEVKLTSYDGQAPVWNFQSVNVIKMVFEGKVREEYIYIGVWEKTLDGKTHSIPVRVSLNRSNKEPKALRGSVLLGNSTTAELQAVEE